MSLYQKPKNRKGAFMAQVYSFYNVKKIGTSKETADFLKNVQRKKSVVTTCLLPITVPSGVTADEANVLKMNVTRKLTVGPESQFIPQYKQENSKVPQFMLLHFSPQKLAWDWLILFIVTYIVIAVPFNIAFKTKDPFIVYMVDLFLELFFIADIFINFRTTFIESQTGRLITDSKTIAINYLKGWFVLDVLLALPFELVYFVNPALESLVSLIKTGRLIRLLRACRRVIRYVEYTATLILLMVCSFVLLAHWLACVWYIIGTKDFESNYTEGWLYKLGNRRNLCSTGNLTYQEINISEQYVSSLYFIFTSLTTVGFGNISPNTVAEKIFAVFVLLMGAIVQSAIFGNMTAIIQKLYSARAKFYAKASQIKLFVRHHQLEGDLRRRIEDWFISQWSSSRGFQTDEMLQSFPAELQSDICCHLYKSFLSLPCFKHASRGCLRSLSLKVRKCHFSPGELIIKESDAINSLYFVQRGTLEVLQGGYILAILGTGDLFGEDISKPKPIKRSNGDVRALMYCDILYLTRDIIKDVLRYYSDFAEPFSRNISLAVDISAKEKIVSASSLENIVEECSNLYSSTNISSTDSESPRKLQRKKPSSPENDRLPMWQQKLQIKEALIERSNDSKKRTFDNPEVIATVSRHSTAVHRTSQGNKLNRSMRITSCSIDNGNESATKHSPLTPVRKRRPPSIQSIYSKGKFKTKRNCGSNLKKTFDTSLDSMESETYKQNVSLEEYRTPIITVDNMESLKNQSCSYNDQCRHLDTDQGIYSQCSSRSGSMCETTSESYDRTAKYVKRFVHCRDFKDERPMDVRKEELSSLKSELNDIKSTVETLAKFIKSKL